MEKRRQNQSCDQCRTAKKACDGYILNGRRNSHGSAFQPTLGGHNDLEAILPCSYCVRTAKKCSLNPQWASIRLSNDKSPACPGPSNHESWMSNIVRPSPRSQEDPNDVLPTPLTLGGESNTMFHMFQNPSHSPSNISWNPSSVTSEGPVTTSLGGLAGPCLFDGVPSTDAGINQPDLCFGNDDWDSSFDANQACLEQAMDNGFGGFNFTNMGDFTSNLSSIDNRDSNPQPYQALPQHRGPSFSTASTRFKKRKTSHNVPEARKNSQAWSENSSISLLPLTAAHAMAAGSNRTLISESLLRIYHDVLENNLACWIAEDTCPYQVEQRQQNALERCARLEWGASWSNRMYRRVKHLDRIAQGSNLIQLTSSQNRAASKALDLVVIAFATQWSQGKRRKEGAYPAVWTDEEESDFGDDFGDEFEKTLQYSVWQQAKKALHELSDLECFRVVYAELVFGLIQKPPVPYGSNEYPEFTRVPGKDADRAAILTHIAEIMAQDGPPVFLERGTRKIHAMKHRFEAKKANFKEHDRLGGLDGETQTSHDFGAEEKETLYLLYWLAIMFDTVSASMNERPVVVGDDECEHHAQQNIPRNDAKAKILNHKWRLELYAQDDPVKPVPLQWPCPYDEATTAVARSAAVKVLLFRYISYLQNALRKNESSHVLEEVLQETMVVYRYWNRTHGALFRDLTRCFDTVPTRLKSWFPCISIPWHFGSLMLADLIDFVDQNHLGHEKSRQDRVEANLAMRIRRSSATELADIAMVIIPQDASPRNNREQLQDFHFAVSDSSALTEPWTILLVQGFAKAAIFHLDEIEEMKKYEEPVLGHESREFQASLKRGEGCVRALFFLGTKSAMAKAVAKAIGRLLQSYEMETC